MRVETLVPEVKVKYEDGADKARWLRIHCEERRVESGGVIECSYEIVCTDPESSGAKYYVTDRLSPWHQPFPAEAVDSVVKETARRFVRDFGVVGETEVELWVVVAPDDYDLED